MDIIKQNFLQAQKILDKFISDEQTWIKLDMAGRIMVHALKNKGKIMSCGNGGSLCDAMHFAEELTERFQQNRIPLPAFAICDPSHITCVANDFGYDQIFPRMVEALGKPGDILLAISSSGNSQNVVNAIESAKRIGMKVVGLTGKTGGQMSALCDVEIFVPHNGYSDRVQEIHIKVIHSLVNYIELSMEEHLTTGSKD
ncbi:MAG: D-sedoheptulose 7-phosphate isomerase [Peptostreptococcaceae bacterium]|nr:D-sedoheptulose 7-phosphate isomerase [Peptostreptococcaceae bacterium]